MGRRQVEVAMPDALLWAVAILLAVAAGWAWNSWRHRVANRRPGTRPGRGTTARTGGRRPAPPRPRGADRKAGTPAPGEIWWADVPYADGSGSKVRPCLVLRADSRGADVLKITSQDKSDRDDHVRIPTQGWDPGAEHDSYLNLTEPIRISSAAFADRAGRCDADLWQKVRSLRHLPTR
ncbi:mRNA-degrading endonuclease toxin of MazEF toxin-antitoxin module [Micromonospora luteifusca]|uniref:mRNA-degrading endonuclease toxin of MazEF toxin-antitoxin module n=1 Tax=Micromonospora luteifusca TaxID=709860 RepID=A0ABS2LXE9_9ACTN|nr:type II toxin-antitoxin system PemK/MazF family toxin [Micromonospora luteifusca]MBM7492868.1 mRNA-degrading endonuclease toxin of MazEF toxin-antitoxin module [Micromonospora luteifusca]